MLIHVQLKLLATRPPDNPIQSGYRSPWWIRPLEPNLPDQTLGTGRLWLQRPLDTQSFTAAIIEPLVEDTWSNLKVGDFIECREGIKPTLYAKVTRILKD